MRCISFPVIVTFLATAASAGERYALVVGVNDCPQFRLSDGSRPRPLRGAESDAEAVGKLLVEQFLFPPLNVTLVLGENATLARLRAALAELQRTSRVGDSVVFYFAGHGTQIRDVLPRDEEDGLDEALCCSDVTADGQNLLLDDEVGRWLDDLSVSAVTVILDSCHSGTGTKEPGDDVASRFLPLAAATPARATGASPWSDLKPSEKALTAQRRVALFACQPEQQAYERRFPGQQPPARSGQFTHYLLDGLRRRAADADGDGKVTAEEAVDYVKRQLDASFNNGRTRAGDRQLPLAETNASGLPVFMLSPQ